MRKLILGCLFILVSGFLGWRGIEGGTDLASLSTIILAMAGGVGAIVYGNVKEHQFNGKSNP